MLQYFIAYGFALTFSNGKPKLPAEHLQSASGSPQGGPVRAERPSDAFSFPVVNPGAFERLWNTTGEES